MPRSYIRHERLVTGERRFKVYRPWWNDPFWWVQGSRPEKMVMAELARRGIFFLHTPQTNNLGGAVDPSWECDIMVPQHRIWIEVQGSYFHSLKGQIEKDSFRYAAIKMAGWRPIFWWEFDILNRLQELMDEVPEFYMAKLDVEARARARYGRTRGLPFNEDGGKGIDHLKGLRTRNAMRRQPVQMIFRRRRPGQRQEK
jgi:G:T-mismatch repair DNA endonuclease (very short patch repair protein)